MYSFGDFYQLPPVGMKAISDIYTRQKLNTSDFQGFFSCSCFIVMDEVIR